VPDGRLWLLSAKDLGSSYVLFFNRLNPSKPLSVRLFSKQINGLLAHMSIKLGKHVRSHSFRATYITDLLSNGEPIQKVRSMVGHRDTSSTSEYDRTEMTLREHKKTTYTLNKVRANGFRILIRESESCEE
jgi:site-specific recombinase XerD